MVVLRSTALAAILAAMFVLPVTAQDCGEDCLPLPPSSVQVDVDPAIGQAHTQDVAAPGVLMPLEPIVSMPAPPAQVVPLGGNPSTGAPSFPKLSVPVRYQDSGDVSCGVQALGMALSAGGGSTPTSSALLGFLQSNGMMYDFGTGVEELAFAAQSFGYRGASPFYGGDVSLLQSELAAGRPVVVSLGVNGDGEPGHFVTVTGISPDGGWISYSDPTLGEMVVPSSEFLRLWGLQGYSGVTVAPAIPPAAPDPLPWVALAASAMALVS
ncbi:MAG TPA: C39 family peptidase, partial [Anaerolineales bacterium]|nr:C39 family peptidase [Anaerolineales bacterium]